MYFRPRKIPRSVGVTVRVTFMIRNGVGRITLFQNSPNGLNLTQLPLVVPLGNVVTCWNPVPVRGVMKNHQNVQRTSEILTMTILGSRRVMILISRNPTQLLLTSDRVTG